MPRIHAFAGHSIFIQTCSASGQLHIGLTIRSHCSDQKKKSHAPDFTFEHSIKSQATVDDLFFESSGRRLIEVR